MAEQSRQRGLLCALLSALTAAFFMIPYKLASEGVSAQTAAFGMLVCAAVLNSALSGGLAYGRAARSERGAPRAPLWVAGALAVLSVAGNICSARALTDLGPATVSAVFRSEVVWVGAAGWVLFGERLTLRTSLGAAVAVLGLLVMRPLDIASSSFLGWLFAIAAAMCFSSMQLVNRTIARRYDLVGVNATRLWLCGLLLATTPSTLATALATDASFWLYSGAAALFGPVISRLLIMYSLRSILTAEASLVMLLAPIFTLLLGWLVLSDIPTPRELVGGGLILLGVAAPLSEHLRRPRPARLPLR